MGNPMTGFGDGVWCGGWWGCLDLREVNARSLARVQGALARPGERKGGAPRRHEGTQGPGHFTVRPCGPHYRAHPLRFYRLLETADVRGTADYADWSRLGAGYRRQDCPEWETQIVPSLR